MNELVSVIMPSYNTASFIGDSIKSVLNQTYQNLELIIIDDCSTDNSLEIIKSFSDKRIKLIENEQNSGTAVCRNNGLYAAKGRWIAFLDSDDLWHKEKLEKQISFMNEKGIAFSYTNYERINEDGSPLGIFLTGPEKINKTDMYNFDWVGCLTVMYDAQKIGLVQIADIRRNNDYALWLKVIKKANCYLLPEILASYRTRHDSISNLSYFKLISWHYKLFRIADNKGVFVSLLFTLRNILFGIYKKLRYTRRFK